VKWVRTFTQNYSTLSNVGVSKKKKTLKISLQTWKNDENCRRRGETLCNLRAL
jgi:hypothetical protein